MANQSLCRDRSDWVSQNINAISSLPLQRFENIKNIERIRQKLVNHHVTSIVMDAD
ncbi:unnamed protein product [Arabidopsis lyrata]|uniref:Predicted protein n=2 Tax=Arabidopsis TaxID=3701 RepID=D7KDU1_ARALL|nr:predicted protein [Arabidopsis lyrata subsp. lyrata]KAG7593307.1 hypothetical protein ISN45_Aa01g021120 [Arabidopsis thaliana x Arabidopsis arenosa]CAH8253868.1 unnamed protein product [Arabidopsis lyrata]